MILITGATGFIGSALVWELNRRGRTDLILVDRFGCADKFQNLLGVKYAQFVDRAQLFEFLETAPWRNQIDTVFHIGANADTTGTDADFYLHWNVEYSRKLCDWSLAHSARFLYASSAAVYGDGSQGFSDDPALHYKLKPLNVYGFSKWLFDHYVIENHLLDQVAGFRFFNVFGPNEYHKGRMASVILHAHPQVRDTGKIRLFESHRPDFHHGEQSRDFIYVKEVLAALLFAYEHPTVKGIFNLGTGRAHSFNQLAAAVFAAFDLQPNIEYFPMPEDLRNRYQYYTCADMAKLQSFGFPAFPDDFASYVKEYVADYLIPHKHLADSSK
ncbi:MAG: ADP-glyceromanno-heptose 6-epimerase [bacterium]|nr:ADP-glyceromanno-heptose 6-epimerase [bacterium]